MNVKYNQWGVVAVLTVTCTFVAVLTHTVSRMHNANSIRNCEKMCPTGLAKYSTTRTDLGYVVQESCECMKPASPPVNAKCDDPCEGTK